MFPYPKKQRLNSRENTPFTLSQASTRANTPFSQANTPFSQASTRENSQDIPQTSLLQLESLNEVVSVPMQLFTDTERGPRIDSEESEDFLEPRPLPPPTRYYRNNKRPKVRSILLFDPNAPVTPGTPAQRTRLGRSTYHAIESYGCFGLIDTGETDNQGYRRIIVHIPKKNKDYTLDLSAGEIMHIHSCIFPNLHGVVRVGYVTPYKYVRPGNPVTTVIVGIPLSQWEMFVDYSK